MRIMINLPFSMRMRFYCVSLILLTASSAHAFDLLDAWHATFQIDPTLAAARAGAEVGQKKTEQSHALKLPQVNFTAGAGLTNAYNKISDAQFSAPGMGSATGANFTTQTNQGTDLRWNVSIEQPIFDAEHFTAARQLTRQAEMAEVKLGAEEQQLMLRVSKAYFDVLLAEDNLYSIKAQRAAVGEALKVAKARFDEGDLPITDSNEAVARDDLLASDQLEVETALQIKRAILADFTGDTSNTLSCLNDQTDFQKFNGGAMADWVSLAQANSPNLRIQSIHRDIARDEIDKHRATNAPVLNLLAQAGQEQLSGMGGGFNSGLSNHAFSIGMQLTIPIFTGGMRDAKMGEAVALEQQAGYELEAMRLKAGQEARATWLGVTVGQSRVKALLQALHSSQVKLEATRLGREVGDRTNLDVLNAEQEYFNATRSLSLARYQLLLAYLGLYASVGNLDETHLAEVNAVLSCSSKH